MLKNTRILQNIQAIVHTNYKKIGMERFFKSFLFTFLLLVGGMTIQEASAQVRSQATKSDSYVLQKQIPDRQPPAVRGTGLPTPLFVVQLARFEEMRDYPAQFPKGTILWVNPDIPTEKFLLVGFYNSFQEASSAAREWKKNKMFPGAFAIREPFMIKYD